MWQSEARRLRLVQLRLECIRLDEAGRLVRASGSDPDEIATCSVARFPDGYDVLFSAEAGEGVIDRATAISQGYGRQVAAAWAAEVVAAGKVAFYSHLDDNQPSRRLAASLAVKPLFDLANVTVEQ